MNRFLTLISLLLPVLLPAQPQVEAPYQKAYNEIAEMLKGKTAYSFKRAVFISENAFLNDVLSYQAFDNQIKVLAALAEYIAENGTLEYDYPDKAKVSKYWGTFMALKNKVIIPSDSILFETVPFTYDFEDFNGEKDWAKMFVTKALFTHSGNCHSLPFLYKIIVEELGEEAWLAMAPNHTYIKHRSMKNGMYNTELTTGQFPIDAWIMAYGYIKLDAVVNAVYMDTLSRKESIAVTLVDLAQGYQKKYGEDHNQEFVLKCLDKALAYYPHYVNALILKAEIHKAQYEKTMDQYGAESPSDLWNDPTLKSQFDQLQAQYAHIHKLGYRKMPGDMYMNWLLDVEERDREEKSARTTFEAPQPFEDYGYKVKTLTLSKGKYQEFFDQEETTEIGSVVFNRMTNSITHFITYDTVRSEATLEPEIISRWISPDPLADERLNVSPYNFVQNNPIVRIDPTGMLDNYAFDRESGELTLVEKTDDDFDQIVKTDRNGKIKRNKKGKAKAQVGNIAKGILKDGQNFKTDDQVIDIGGEVQPSLGEVEDFVTRFSEFVGVEISGAYLSQEDAADADISKVIIDEYKGNGTRRSSMSLTGLVTDPNLTGLNTITAFHTHPSNLPGVSRTDVERPSGTAGRGGDLAYRRNQASYFYNFLILTRTATYPKRVQRIDYTNWKK